MLISEASAVIFIQHPHGTFELNCDLFLCMYVLHAVRMPHSFGDKANNTDCMPSSYLIGQWLI